MQFNSYTFILFFAFVIAVQMSPLPWWFKKANLLVASYLFYAAWKVPYVLLIWLSTIVDWYVAKALSQQEDPQRRKFWLVVSLTSNLGLLAVFKYTNFLFGTVESIVQFTGAEWTAPAFNILLPVGISFYTFQTLSYTIDVYRRAMLPAKSFLDYALYVAFFPQLVAGPIVRAIDFIPQCLHFRRPNSDDIGWGLTLLIIGIWQKTVLADGLLAVIVERQFAYVGNIGFIGAWTGTLAFAGQILFDFAGYSSSAIGIARCLGFTLPPNFRFPYAAIGFSDFWRRWHISLSGWLRDYLYISLGGNRLGQVRILVNLMATMLLGGLWHGASWNYVVWGALHGAYLIVERFITHRLPIHRWKGSAIARFAAWAGTFVAVCVAWVFFRIPDFSDAMKVVRAMFRGPLGPVPFADDFGYMDFTFVYSSLIMVSLFVVSWRLRDVDMESWTARLHPAVRGLVGACILLSIATMAGKNRAFIYFQF
jgi:alginate O-acetyltransferase complex protein AlgI